MSLTNAAKFRHEVNAYEDVMFPKHKDYSSQSVDSEVV